MNNEYTAGKRRIGRGAFSRVYDDGDSVLIVSNCWAKECRFTGWGSTSRYFPTLEKIGNSFCGEYNVYRQKKYLQPKSLKKSLAQNDYLMYRALRDIYSDLPPYMPKMPYLYFDALNNKIGENLENILGDSELSYSLVDELAALKTFGHDVIFEISPRNVAVDNGNLILLDCFYFYSQLQAVNNKKALQHVA